MPKTFPFRVEWTQTAVTDLAAIVDYISEESIENALSVLKKLEETAEKLTTMPLRGRIVPELASFGIQIYRQLIHAPWRIIYRVSGKKVNVMAVLDSRRNLEDILLERLVRVNSGSGLTIELRKKGVTKKNKNKGQIFPLSRGKI